MNFYDIDPMALELGSQFYYNILVHVLLISENDDSIIPLGVEEQWYCDGLTDARPKIYGVCRTNDLDEDSLYEVECHPHSVVEITKEGEVTWYNMLDFDTNDPWAIGLEFEEEDDDDFCE